MDILDYFAGQAIRAVAHTETVKTPREIAQEAYALADAMLAEKNSRAVPKVAVSPCPEASEVGLGELWNEVCGERLAKVRLPLNPSRALHAKTLLKRQPLLEEHRKAMSVIHNSEFCCGVNDRGWKATFDFYLRPATMDKALEGLYNSKDDIKNPGNEKFHWKYD